MNAFGICTSCTRKRVGSSAKRPRLLTGLTALLVCAMAAAATAAAPNLSQRGKAPAARALPSSNGMLENPQTGSPATAVQQKAPDTGSGGASSGTVKVCLNIPTKVTRTYRQPVIDKNGRIHYEYQTFTRWVWKIKCYDVKKQK